MKAKVLFLDTITAEMERIFYSICPEKVELKFLNPQDDASVKGTFDEADYYFVVAYKVGKKEIDKGTNLKMIQRTGVGYDHVDIEYAKSKNIPVAIASGMNASSVSELAVLHILALYRKFNILNADAKEGLFDSWKYRHESFEIFGKTIGVIGAGAIGRAVIRKLNAFEPESILYYDVVRQTPEKEKEIGITFCELDELMKRSDIVTLHIPLFDSTRMLINRDRIAMMKPNAILINTARGPIVDQEALVEAVREGKIAGAGLDVYVTEPYVIGDDVLRSDRITTTPHIGAATVDNFRRSFRFCSENVLKHYKGETPQNVVNNG